MFVKIDPHGYFFDEKGIKIIEDKYDAKYVGYWCTKRPSGGWNETPVDVFYVENPDRSKGHSNYFGMFIQNNSVMITNAESCFEEPIAGILCEDGEVLVSRYRHDYVEKDGHMIDGGRDYVRCSANHPRIGITIENGNFILKELTDA